MNYPSIRIEGSILSPDILDRLDDGQPGQKASDFGFSKDGKVKDEIARAWADAQDYWRIFQRKLETAKDNATTETRQNWIVPLFGLLKYDVEFQKAGTEINGKNYAISHRVTNRANTPLHIVGYNDAAGLDRKGSQRMSAHALIQQYLNLADELYGIVTNGRVIRLLRDSSRLIKQSYLEFDLDRIFNDGLFADFAILFRLLHATRLPQTTDANAESLIEKYHQDSLDSGARIRDGLSKAVETAIINLGNGFLAHPANQPLRDCINNGQLTAEEYYKSLLRLIYRLLFLMVIEERDLVFPADVPKAKRDIYRNYYSVQRLRNMSEKRYLADKRHHDLWQALLSTFRLFEADGPGEKLGIKPLAGDLFSAGAIHTLINADYIAELGNDVLLNALRSLSLYEHPDTKQIIRVNYAALNVEEFGSVYEGLLEYKPNFSNLESGIWNFEFVSGDERSRTGSHYTPDELVQPLIKHSLDYLIEDALSVSASPRLDSSLTTDHRPLTTEERLLALRVADIACGSGHILLAAARRIATELATVRTGEEQPSPTAYRQALRDVIRNCIYGVDINPLAVELCKVALWLEAHNPGEPLNFLDHHIKCGNAIVGFVSQAEVDRGIPEEAFKKMPGDDTEFLKALRKRNKDERKTPDQKTLNFTDARRGEMAAVLERLKQITAMPENTPAEIEAKSAAYRAFSTGGATYDLEMLASVPIAQFYIPKTPENTTKIMTDREFREYWSGERRPQSVSYSYANAVAVQNKFFHWFLEFPEIMERGGFDCILGNPPYLGGGKLSTTYGAAFNAFVKFHFDPAHGQVDLLGYFFRRIFQLLSSVGATGLIGTNTATQGDTRLAGIQVIIDSGGFVTFAYTAVRWPGEAAVDVVLLGFAKGISPTPILNGRSVNTINSNLADGEQYVEPLQLAAQRGLAFKGSEPVGEGFLLSHVVAQQMMIDFPNESDVYYPFLIGDDVSNSPIQEPSRHCIYLGTMPLQYCETHYPNSIQYLRNYVHPFRSQNNDRRRREIWWQFSRPTESLYSAVRNLANVMIVNRHAKYHAIAVVASNLVYSDATVVIAKSSWFDFAVYSSNLHEAWAWFRGSTIGSSGLRYTPSSVFETFCEADIQLELHEIGERYHEHRRQLMLTLWLGLTKLYNLFHDPDLSVSSEQWTTVSKGRETAIREGKSSVLGLGPLDLGQFGCDGIVELRRLHVEMDNAVRDAYGWQDLDLEHGFHEVETLPENDRTRFTISPTARKEVLKRLLALNHERAAEESAEGKSKKAKGKSRKPKTENQSPKTNIDNPLLSAGPLFD